MKTMGLQPRTTREIPLLCARGEHRRPRLRVLRPPASPTEMEQMRERDGASLSALLTATNSGGFSLVQTKDNY
uniref:Uncharacterized protein n=1 Tax=Oryza meridionalis TaxID=40149 RepID=A0A0E0DE63_9ORYZ